MSLSIVGTPVVSTLAIQTTSWTVGKPSGLKNGDMLVVGIRFQTNGATDASCAGFARITTPFVPYASRVTGFYAKIITDAASEPTSYTWTDMVYPGRWAGAAFIVRSSTVNAIVIGEYSPSYSGTAITNGRRIEAFTTTHDGLILGIWGAEFSANSSDAVVSPPAALSEVVSAVSDGAITVSRTRAWMGFKALTAGSTSALDLVFGSIPSGPDAQAVALYEDAPSVSTALTVGIFNGTTEDVGHAYVLETGDIETPLSAMLALPWRGYTITEMDADIAAGRDVFWAHRGGSANWSEMSLRAYTNAAWWGTKALEISVIRSSDGIWIMNHDIDLTRTTATSYVIPTTASSTLLGIPIDTPTTGGVVGRIEDVLDTYSDLLLIIDNKTSADATGLYNLIKAHVPDWENHVIIKFVGESAPANFIGAISAGFKTCSYYYDTTAWSLIQANIAYCDYPGLNFSASQTVWDNIMALSGGKPMWAHVLGSPTDYATAKARGAKIFQCADVRGIVPVINPVT